MMEVLGCKRADFPFTYLGIKVGAKMTRIFNWEPVVDVIKGRLASWKAKHLSIGGRLILIKSVLESLPVYYFSLYKAPKAVIDSIEMCMRRFLWAGSYVEKKISWVAWDIVTLPKQQGGLGISKLQEVNDALLLKWTWRFKTEDSCLWKKGSSRPWAMLPCNATSSGCWKYIVKVGDIKVANGMPLNSFFVGNLGDGQSIYFWGDVWLRDAPLCIIYPNLFRLEKDKWIKVADRMHCVDGFKTMAWDWKSTPSSHEEVSELFQLLNDVHNLEWQGGVDNWKWKDTKDGLFKVSSAKRLMSNDTSGNCRLMVKWKGWTPLKCKILVWRALLNRIPTVVELIKRGVNILDTACSLCHSDLETALHLFTGCIFSHEVWFRIELWCRLNHTFIFDVTDLIRVPESTSMSKDNKHILRGIVYTFMWVLWIERNDRIFNDKKRSPIQIVENIKYTAYFWLRNRTRWKDIEWKTWCICPLG
ncbi:putative reverse transcriptase zinc-binding domain-containing protein [Helianthus annuus]|nr:putative reverse transcriptase zinc-binding domain-containing protein [Helianthus annuus]